VYEDDSKQEEITVIQKDYNGSLIYTSVIDKGLNTPPDSPELGDSYFVGNNPTGDWISFSGLMVIWSDNSWYVNIPTKYFYVVNDSAFYKKKGKSYKKVKDSKIFNEDTWNDFFSLEELNKKDNNLIKSTYNFLKTKDEFSGVTDC
jgi:hypothetical protein